jgi:4'-phosphopantetheinyl transferase
MGLYLKKCFDNDIIFGIWEITEDMPELMDKLVLNETELKRLDSFLNFQRKLEWLSVRCLINELTGKNCKIVYNENRKPFLNDNSYNISISHSNRYTSIMLGKNCKVGVDLEYMSHKITKVASKFMHPKEYINPDPLIQQYHLYIHWCAKEAIYKICDKQDINFKENIYLDAFEPKESGQVRATLENHHGIRYFMMNYFRDRNYIIVWCEE